jgi:hypothetical protein
MTITPELIAAYVDGELGPEEQARIDAAMDADPAIAGQVAAHLALSARLTSAYAPVLGEAIPDRLLAPLRSEPKVADLGDFRRQRQARFGGLATWGAIAACLVIGVGVGLTSPQFLDAGLISKDLKPSRQLASALDKGLAGETQGGVQIGVTFRNQAGAYCRTFQAPKDHLAGLACREKSGWAVQVAARAEGAATSVYRTASSIPPAVASAVDAMIDGAPLDSVEEKAARDRWLKD